VKKDPPLQQLEELKAFLFPYLIIGPLLAALFAERIDNLFAACFFFVVVVGFAFSWVRKKLIVLEELIREQDDRLRELDDAVSGHGCEEKKEHRLLNTAEQKGIKLGSGDENHSRPF
jgi:hypothetical protein